jgi:hypothetical protein
LAAYLIWLMGDTRNRWDAMRGLLDRVAPPGVPVPPLAPSNSNVRSDWTVILERLQILACLLAAEASRRGFDPDAAIVDHVRWELPQVWPKGERGSVRLTDETYFEAPPFPSDAAYERCDVGQCDSNAYQLGAASQTSLAATREGAKRPFGEVWTTET